MPMKKPQMANIKGARTATKKQERELIDRARRLRDDPRLALPDFEACGRRCFLCPFARALSRMEKIQGYADDESKLQKLASGGDDISMAYAATLLLALSGKAPFFGRVLTPFGEALFAYRGKARKEKLILVQHFDDAGLRLIGLLDMVRDKGYHIYSMDERFFCMGKEDKPPQEFIDYMFEYLKERIPLEKDKDTFRCSHLTAKDLKDPTKPFLDIKWISAEKNIAICEKCARSSGNTFARFLLRMGVPKPRTVFEISVAGALSCVKDCQSCDIELETIDPELMEQYYTGQIGDSALLSKQLTSIRNALIARGERVYVIGNKCYGTDKDAFLKALSPGPDEQVAVKVLLKRIEGPIIVEGETAAKLIEQSWKDYGMAILTKLLDDKELAKEHFNSVDNLRVTPAQVIKDAIIHVKKRDVISQLPEYEKLPSIARYADQVARVFMSSGPDEAARHIERNIPDDGRIRPVALALLKAMGKDTVKAWAFAEHEREFSDYLKDAAKAFLDATPETYNDALQKLLSSTGSTEIIVKKEKPKAE